MQKSQMIVEITVICGCRDVGNLATYYGGGPRDEHAGGIVPFLQEMTARGWQEVSDDQWICPACVAKKTGLTRAVAAR